MRNQPEEPVATRLHDSIRTAVVSQTANAGQAFFFPDGPWIGFFLQLWLPGRHETTVEFRCSEGRITGEGTDWVGPFTVDGWFDPATGDCGWTKQYLGKHAVLYRGVSDHHGIWGVWEINRWSGLYVDRGGFHLWPQALGPSEDCDRTEQAVLQAMRKVHGFPPFVPFFLAGLIALGAYLLTNGPPAEWWRNLLDLFRQ